MARRYDRGLAVETSERLNFARELRARAHAELGVDVSQVAGDRPLAEEQRGGDLAIGAALGNEDRHAALGRRQPFLARAPADAAELLLRLLDPDQCAEALEAVERREDRLAGRTLLPRAAMDDAECKQRAGVTVGISDGFVLRDRLLQEHGGPFHVAGGGGDEPAGSRCG